MSAAVDPATGHLSVTWGPEFVDLDQPRWSPNSSAVAYAGARSRDEWVVVVGTEPRATYRDVTGVTFRPDGTLAYIASDGSKHFMQSTTCALSFHRPARRNRIEGPLSPASQSIGISTSMKLPGVAAVTAMAISGSPFLISLHRPLASTTIAIL